MSRDLLIAISGALGDDVVYPLFGVELLFDSPNELRLWSGVGDLSYGGQTYTGGGNLLNISSIEETGDIAARGATLSLSGIPSEVISLALQEQYQGRVCNILFGVNISGVVSFSQVFSGYMDQMNILETGDTCTIELSVENKLIDLERQRVRRYSSGYQKSIYPGDKGFDFVEDIQDKEVYWGRNAPGSLPSNPFNVVGLFR